MDLAGLISNIVDATSAIDFGRKGFAHVACIAHRTRLQNMLRTPGVDIIEKAMLKQRFSNLSLPKADILKSRKKHWRIGIQLCSFVDRLL